MMEAVRMNPMMQDLRVTLRRLLTAPAFTVTAVLILSLGIGMTAAMLTVVNAVLLHPLPVQDPDRIVLPRTVDSRGTDISATWDQVKQLEHATHTLGGIAGEAHQGAFDMTLLDGGRPLVMKTA